MDTTDDFLIDKIQPDEIGEELVNVGELVANEVWQIINDIEHSLQEDHTMPERDLDPEQSEIERRENTNLRILEWKHNLEADEKEALSIQQVDVSANKYVKSENPLFSWTATERPLETPQDNLSHVPSMGTSTPGSGGRTYRHQKFNDKEAQGSERDKRPGAGPKGG